MTFKESIISVYVKNHANFKGKASRSELWWAFLFYLIVAFVGTILLVIIAGIIDGMTSGMLSESDIVNGKDLGSQIGLYYGVFLMIISFLPFAAVHTRRFHDVGKSTKEALTIYVVTVLSDLFFLIPDVAIIQTNELFVNMMGFVCLISNAYGLYIYVKKPV